MVEYALTVGGDLKEAFSSLGDGSFDAQIVIPIVVGLIVAFMVFKLLKRR